MSNLSSNNKRIVKNTYMLYIRMLLTMVVALYTSRVVLNVLGVEDYGIYNLIVGLHQFCTLWCQYSLYNLYYGLWKSNRQKAGFFFNKIFS